MTHYLSLKDGYVFCHRNSGKRTRKDDGGTGSAKSAPPAAAGGKDADTLELERSLSERLGLTVTIEPAKNNPEQDRVTVAYQDLEQLDEIMGSGGTELN